MKYQVWDEETGDQFVAQTVEAFDHEAAAEEWARQDDWGSAEYGIVSGRHTPVVCVRQVGTEDVRRFSVRGEAEPVYYADELDELPDALAGQGGDDA